METDTNRRAATVVNAASGGAMLVGILVLFGWAAGVETFKRLAPGLVAMNPTTAVLFVFAGGSLWLQRSADAGRRADPARTGAARVLAVLVILVAALKLTGALAGWTSGVDQWLFAGKLDGLLDSHPNRMAPNTALNFLLLGAALLSLGVTTRRGHRPSEILASLAFVIALLTPMGEVYKVPQFAGWSNYIPMALHTAATFLVLSVGVFAARPKAGMMAVVASASPGGVMARRLFPAMTLALLLMGWLRLEGERRNLYGMELGVALYTIANIMVLGLLVWRSANSLHLAAVRQREGDERLRLSEERTQAIIETASDAFVAMDSEGIVIGWNRQAEATFGWSRKDVVGRPLSDMIIPPQHREAHERGIRHFAATGSGPVLNARIEITAVRRHGEEFPVELAIWPVHAGGTYTFNAFIRDITERKRVEEMQSKFAAIIESSDDAIISKTLGGIITTWNPGAERIFGYTASEAIGQPMTMLIPPERAHEEPALLARLARGERENFETVRVRKDGKRIDIAVTISPITDATGRVVGASKIARDITERKRAQENILALNEQLSASATQLEVSNRELEAFSYTISHDLRAPLRHIDGYAGMLQEDAGHQLDAEMRRYLDAISAAARQMGALIDDLLAFSKLGRKPVVRSLINMEQLVERVRQDIGVDFSSGAHVTIGPLPAAHADPALLKQVWINLLSNALKYSAPRGPDARVEVSGEQVGDRVRYRIRDNGVGFDMRYADKLFGVFQRMHSQDEFEGTGVGLAICQRIVSRHGGTIEASSTPGLGATFTFDLPAGADSLPLMPETEAVA